MKLLLLITLACTLSACSLKTGLSLSYTTKDGQSLSVTVEPSEFDKKPVNVTP